MKAIATLLVSGLIRVSAVVLTVFCAATFCAVTAASVESDNLIAQISSSFPSATASPVTATELVSGYGLVVSAAEKVGRELRADEVVTVSGERQRTLWLLPKGAELDRSFEKASELIKGEELFRCAGRDCGRSTAWANLVYNEALLFGQDRYQRYRVVRHSDSRLLAIYAIRRGNRRVHLLLETIELNSELSDAALAAGGISAAKTLARQGLADLTVVPAPDGTFGAAALSQLKLIGVQLAGLTEGDLYVVCHLYGNAPTETLLAQSDSCAEDAMSALKAGYEEGDEANTLASQNNRARPADTRFLSYGAGPLLPRLRRDNALSNRLELVQPNQLKRP